MTVHYLRHEDIDLGKWDRCIAESSNGSVYVYSAYLDHMSEHWDALVLGDYEVVMPLTWNRKWGISYLYQPHLSAEGGVFQQEPVTAETLKAFLEAVPGKFWFWEFALNAENLLPDTGFPLYPRANFLLPMQATYKELSAAYNNNLKRNLRKGQEAGLTYIKNVPVTTVLDLADQKLAGITPLRLHHYQRFIDLFRHLEGDNMAVTRGVADKEGRLLASGVFLFSHTKAYYLIGGNHPEGRDTGASHLLLDQFINEHAGSGLTFDFEGSDIPSLAQFYRSFGAYEQPYAAIKLNRLPGPLRWLKR